MATEDAVAAALRAALAALAGSSDGSQSIGVLGTVLGEVGTDLASQDQLVKVAVPRVPTVPSKKQYTPHCTRPDDAIDAWATWQERAAIREFDGRMMRAEAEALTAMERGPCPAIPANE